MMTLEDSRKKLENDFYLPNLKIDFEKSVRDYKLSKNIFSRLINEINVTIRFYVKTYKFEDMNKLFLTGGLSLIPGIDEFMGAIFEIDGKKLEIKKGKMEFPSNFIALSDFM